MSGPHEVKTGAGTLPPLGFFVSRQWYVRKWINPSAA